MSVIFHNPMTFFIIQEKSLWEFIEYQSTYLRAVVLDIFSNRSSCDRRARRENNKMNNTHAELNFYSSSNEKGLRQFQKLQMKNTNWSFNILMIFHEFSLLNFLWSCRHFILFSIFKISHFLKLEKFWRIFEQNFPDGQEAKISTFSENIHFLTKITTFCRKYPLFAENIQFESKSPFFTIKWPYF